MLNTRLLVERGYHQPPRWLPDNVQYETQMGSIAYGVASESSDVDLYGFCIPPLDLIFPHLAGEIPGFGQQVKRFEQYQQHHIESPDELGGKGRTYDVTMFSIVKFFDLAMRNNPNMVDALFTPQTCVLTCTQIGQLVRENRRAFLHKGSWHSFKGYAYSQLAAIEGKKRQKDSKRGQVVEQFGWDVKFGYHTVRLMLEVEQILAEGDLDLQRHREQLKAIRTGEWTLERLRQFFAEKEQQLERLYHESPLPWGPDEAKLKALLLQCLEAHYGSLTAARNTAAVSEEKLVRYLQRIKVLCEEAGV